MIARISLTSASVLLTSQIFIRNFSIIYKETILTVFWLILIRIEKSSRALGIELKTKAN